MTHSSNFKLENLKTKLNWIVTGSDWSPRESALTPEEAALILKYLPQPETGTVDKKAYQVAYADCGWFNETFQTHCSLHEGHAGLCNNA